MAVFVIALLSSCITTQPPKCPSGTYWDGDKKVCVQIPVQEEKPACPQDSEISLDNAVSMGIKCVKADPSKFDKVFATFISIARENPDIENGEKILGFINAIAIDAPYVSAKRAKMKWNRYFSPYLFVTFAYEYENVANYCKRKNEIKKQVMAELENKKTGLLYCMADQANKVEVGELYRQAEETARSLSKGLDAACLSCCDRTRIK